MAGWSMIADDGSILYSSETLQKPQKNELSFDLEPTSNECGGGGVKEGEKFNELRCLFDRFTSVFLKENCGGSSCYRPLPAMLGDGRCVDLFNLFLVVREKGGYVSVSKNGLWDLVAEESGFDRKVTSAVKLIYIKYLDMLERWLERVLREKKSGRGLRGCGANSDEFLLLLEVELNSLLSGIEDEKKKDEGCPALDLMHGLKFTSVGELCNAGKVNVKVEFDGGAKCVDNDPQLDLTSGTSFMDAGSSNGEEARGMAEIDGSNKCIDDDLHSDRTSEFDIPDVKKSCGGAEILSVLDSDVAKKCVNDDEDGMSLGSEVTEDVSSRKRKRGSMWGMLNWIIKTAKNPCDPVIGVIPEKLNAYGNEVLWKQVLLARDTLFLKRELESSVEQSIWQKEQRMHPSMYDDQIGSGIGLTEKLRCSPRLLSVKKPHAQNSPDTSSSATQSGVDENPSHCMEGTSHPLTEDSPINMLINSRRRKRVLVGPLRQANIPEWTGLESESDSKWLGTQLWPLGKREKRSMIEREHIRKGRQDSCGCPLPGSGECVRFHIGEKRMRVKLDLGSAFYLWKFHKMGEDVTLSWTMEEEKKFKTIVSSTTASLDNCFWNQMFMLFPRRSREDLVSYYFNVFLLRRRGDQNRLTPDNIDSDDDESEFGPVTNVFEREVTNSPGSILYSPNKTHKNLR